jgi:hypothetical protein
MSNDRNVLLKEQLLDEIWDELSALEGHELDQLLIEVGLSPEVLQQEFAESIEAAVKGLGRARFEEARQSVRTVGALRPSKIVSLDLARKRQVMAAIKERAANTNEMTIAARNQKIEAEEDLDSFLEACVRLGLIDEDGNLKN